VDESFNTDNLNPMVVFRMIKLLESRITAWYVNCSGGWALRVRVLMSIRIQVRKNGGLILVFLWWSANLAKNYAIL
jgi:hypothetical protein